MALESDHCESGEIYCTIEDFLILKELQSPFTYKLQMKSWTESVLYTWGAQMNLVAYTYKDELKREHLSLTCNISGLCDISVNLLGNNAL